MLTKEDKMWLLQLFGVFIHMIGGIATTDFKTMDANTYRNRLFMQAVKDPDNFNIALGK